MSLLAEGQIFARYRALHLLGSSASGECYEVEDVELQHKLVLKLIHPWQVLSEAAQYQFIREMQHISTITHPRLTEIFDYGEVNGHLYLTRHYVTAGSLIGLEGRRLFPTPMSLTDAIKYTYQLAHTLYYLHMHDYVHGSLTFANILVLDESYVEQHTAPFCIADAGVAHFVRRFGQQQSILPLTTAPEQFDHYVSPATDQYALAVLLYLWLTGRPPFLGSTEEIRHVKLREIFSSPSALRAEISLEQESILRKALHAKPDERYPSIIGFAEALLATLSWTPQASAQPIEPAQPPDPLPPMGPDVPQPLPAPEPIPQSIPEEIPNPEPIPTPDSTPTPDPIPTPEIPPSIEPDIAQPMPEPSPIPQPQEPPTEPRLLLRSPQSSQLHTLPLTLDEITLGRAEANTIVLDQDDSTSRRHAIIRRDQHNFVVYDWDSINGVIVNGQRLTTDEGHVLQEGDIISIGAYTFTFQASSSTETTNGAVSVSSFTEHLSPSAPTQV